MGIDVHSLEVKMSLTTHVALLVCVMLATEFGEFPLEWLFLNLDYFVITN